MVVERIAWTALVAFFSISTASFAQEFREFVSKEDLFSANFPGEPMMTTIDWETQYGAKLTGRAYTAKRGPRTYSMTVVDYNPVQTILTAKSKECPPGLERCNGLTSFAGAGYWKTDVRGAMIYAAFKYMQRPEVKVTNYMWSFLGGMAIESNEMQLVNTQDQSRTFVTIYMHHNRLYIAEETSPANYPPPGLFVQSVSIKEPDGQEANHDQVYFNGPEVDPTETNEFSRNNPRFRQLYQQQQQQR